MLLTTSLNNKVIAVLNKKLSFNEKKVYRLKLSSFHNEKLISSEFVQVIVTTTNTINETTITENAITTTTALKQQQLTPLEFENSTYSISIPSNIITNSEIIEIKLRNANKSIDTIVYSLVFDEDDESINNLMNYYFKIDENNGIIRIITSIQNLNINLIKLKVKATYKNLLNNLTYATKNDTDFNKNYFYNYLIPAFCVVKINVFVPTTSVVPTTTTIPATTTTTTIVQITSTYPLIYYHSLFKESKINDFDIYNNKYDEINIFNFNETLNINKGLNSNECVVRYELSNKEIINYEKIKFQVLNQISNCLKYIEISKTGCLKLRLNETCDTFETDFKFKVCSMNGGNEKCSKIYTQNLLINSSIFNDNNKKNSIALFFDYAQQSLFNSAIVFYGFLISLIILVITLSSLLCWLNRRKKRLLNKKSRKINLDTNVDSSSKELNFASIVSAIKNKIMNAKPKFDTKSIGETLSEKKVAGKKYNDGCTLPHSEEVKIIKI